ncbi:sensor histidine kinase [Aequorivita echinoideorum]|uniref:histidine kinase n=1 Tax=Aequorivita echinoideorum TaxID=1549647 RepID=A0ABS5S3A6_9FLAO|nr:HAMP domain-containing sensor histidine kinase [Aequorivita echinoideorum]MBT0606882.1 HAMP domain-containing histidine kinase [Aequorivita echinoideorum]
MRSNRALTRWIFILASIFIITLILWNTYIFFIQLKENERAKMEIWASAYQELQQKSIANDPTVGELVLSVIQSNSTTPMILYTIKEKTYTERNIDSIDVSTLEKKQELIAQFSSEYTPIEIYNDDALLSTIYYGNSPLINKLKYYPAFLILIIFLFVLAVYLFYRTSKSAEQNKLWAGMAKETAHQIGTPLSSLVGWTELLKSENVNPEYIKEMEKDVVRLEMITDRFSKIGSVPNLERKDLVTETKNSFEYLKARTSKMVNFELDVPENPIYVELNQQLFSWTIENLVKNGIDAMKGKGNIKISISQNSKYALVRVQDSGKGIPKSHFKKVFMPGFTTKKRGWGLGLSLAKRIIEEYHNGKIRVLKSSASEGTIMEIAIKPIS